MFGPRFVRLGEDGADEADDGLADGEAACKPCEGAWTGVPRWAGSTPRKVSQLHKLLLELIPGGAKRSLSGAQAKELLRKVRPTTAVGKVRKAHAAELVADLATIYARSKAADKELKVLVKATGTILLHLHGIGPSGAARLLAEVADITRFPDRNHFASWNGTAPIDASSGDHTRHRLSRKGNRQINRVLHIMAVVQLRNATEGRAYYDRKKAAGKTSMEAMRCLNEDCPEPPRRVTVTSAGGSQSPSVPQGIGMRTLRHVEERVMVKERAHATS